VCFKSLFCHSYQIDYIDKRLADECRLGERCPSLLARERAAAAPQMVFNGIGDGDRKFSETSKLLKENQGQEGALSKAKDNLRVLRQLWRRSIIGPLQKTQVFAEMLFNFKHAETSRISDQVIAKLGSMLSKGDTQQPKFALGVKIDRLPGMISPVRVLVCCVYTKNK
jgi:hypothetical protein